MTGILRFRIELGISCALALMTLTPAVGAHAGDLSVLYAFAGAPNDGSNPVGSLLEDGAGNLFGTTESGGSACSNYGGCGTVFKLSAGGTEKLLYSFCTQANCSDGETPEAGLIEDKSNNLYGTTVGGGANGRGTIFEVTPTGQETVLYSFCTQEDCVDGSEPIGGLVMDSAGNLYGTTEGGGANSCGCGTVFEFAPDGTETVLHSFAGYPSDGALPSATLYMDSSNNLYGVTLYGGDGNTTNCDYGCGTVFKVNGVVTEIVLHSFCVENNCPDGSEPSGALMMDPAGNLYGTTGGGGANCSPTGCGTVFELAPSGTETVVYSFCSKENCEDGRGPVGGVVANSEGVLYGTTYYGGHNRHLAGEVFKIAQDGSERVLTRVQTHKIHQTIAATRQTEARKFLASLS